MRVLLVGEYSGLFKNLKEGLLELGHDVVLAADGDGWKKIDGTNFPLSISGKNIFRKIDGRILHPFRNEKNMANFDVVQLVNANVFIKYINLLMIKKIRKNNAKLFLSAAGDDYYTYKAYIDNKFEYLSYDGDKQIHCIYDNSKFMGKQQIKNDIIVADIVDGIIPIMYEYAEAYRDHPKRKETIPIAMNIEKINYMQNEVKNKVVIFHGINRELPKGTAYIRKAFEIIKDKYNDEVEVIIDCKMPLNEYLNVIRRANIIVDQCKGYSWGMNAVYSMAQGKIVMSGAEPEALAEFGLQTCPIINIRPKVEDIVLKLEQVIKNKKNIAQMGYESRKFVEDFHDYRKVAQRYVECWNSTSLI